MEDTTSTLLVQLRTLLQLTQTEAQVAATRVAQATTDAVRRELTQNAGKAEERARLLADALRELGGAPDVLAPAIGRFTALIKAGAEQVAPVSEALLGDLALEHQLVDRARYLRALAVQAGRPSLVALADRLLEAHNATVEWLTTVLAEEALGGPAAIAATPFQRVAGTATRLAVLPTRVAVEGVNRSVEFAKQIPEQVRTRLGVATEKVTTKVDEASEKVGAAREQATQLGRDAREVAVAGRDASLAKAERVAEREGNPGAAEAVHETRAAAGALSASELPIRNYENLSNQDAIVAIKKLTEAEDIRAVLAFEAAHKDRSSVVSAAQTTLAAIAKDAAGVS